MLNTEKNNRLNKKNSVLQITYMCKQSHNHEKLNTHCTSISLRIPNFIILSGDKFYKI